MLKQLFLVFLLICAQRLHAANSVPTDVSLSVNAVNENSISGTLIGVLSSVDADVLDAHTYTLVAGVGSTNNASFSISGNQLLTSSVLNYELKNSFSIRIQSNDGNGGIYQKVFTINVNDVNESPIYYDGSVSIAENLGNTSNVFATLASDEDAAQALSFSIVSGNTNGAFAINASTGMISVANSSALNFEVNPVFNLVIRATDNGLGTLYDDALIVISLLDLNDSPVITVPGAKIVNEFTNLNITSISVADEDVGADSLSVSLSVSHGKLSLSSSAGLRFVLGNGSSNSAMQFYGKLSAINVAFTSIIYISDDDYVGSELLSMDVDDLGHNGSGGAQSSSKTIAITVNPIAVSFNVQTVGATICQTRNHLFYVQTSGTNPMTYQWKHNGTPILGATNDSLQITNSLLTDAGTYQCDVTNPAGIFSSTAVNLVVHATPRISFSSNEVCVGSTTYFTNTTQIDHDNIATYDWAFDDNGAVSSLLSPSRIFSVDGTFNVSLIVTSDQACADTLVQPVIVNPYPQTNFSIGDICFVDTLKPINTSTINLGTISYVWNFGDGSTSIQKNPKHKYVSTDSYILTLTSTSNKGCSTSKNQTITVNPSPIANFVVPDICDSTEAKFQGVSSISSGTMTHFWDFGDGDTNYNEINPSHLYDGHGTYQVQLKVVSDKSCEDSVVKDIKVYHNPDVKISTVDPLCFGAVSGSITAESSMGMAPYFYSLNGGSFTLMPVFGRLGAGIYSLLVMDNRNCVTKKNVVLTQPEKLIYSLENIVDIKCAGNSTGSYLVIPEGGTEPYSFWVNKTDLDTNIFKYEFADTGYFANLKAKSYPNLLADHNGCKIRFSVTIAQPSPVSILVENSNVTCNGLSDGKIAVEAKGGVGDYSYSINGGLNYQKSNVFSSLIASDYLVSLKDGNGCGASLNVNLIEPNLRLSAHASVLQHVKCFGDSTATVLLSSDGGTGVVQYSLNNQNSYSASTLLSNLPFGTYKAYVQDENSCIDSIGFSIAQPSYPLSIQNVVGVNATCYGSDDASLSVIASGGTGAIKYSISQSFQSNNTFQNLLAGAYLSSVKDANGCVDTQLVVLQEPSQLYFDSIVVTGVSCKNDAFGVAKIKVLGGIYPYNYTVGSAYQMQGLFNTLEGGEYHAFVSDDNGCVVDTLIDIPYSYETAKASFTPFVAGKVITFNNSSTNALTYEWNFGDGTKAFTALPIHQFPNKGIYTVSLKVSNQCNSDSVSTIVNIGSVGVEEEAHAALSLYPNPCDDNFSLDFSNQIFEEQNSVFTLYDALGTLLLSTQFSFQENSSKINFSTKELASGKYFVRISNDKFTIVKSVEVIH